MKIAPLPIERFDEFFDYLSDHLSDNGNMGTPIFQPISKEELGLSEMVRYSFKNGTETPIGFIGWRRIFIAVNAENKIIGHIDMKSLNQAYAHHRGAIGMGVHRSYRKLGLGQKLIEYLINWVNTETPIEYIDLNVLSNNLPAIRLYERLGFITIGETKDMFRIDGKSYDYKKMTYRIK